jgi:hypothetical protein
MGKKAGWFHSMMILKWDFVLDLHLNKNIFYGELIILVNVIIFFAVNILYILVLNACRVSQGINDFVSSVLCARHTRPLSLINIPFPFT